jgi:tetratricopeptide (TPR) repeat protein
LNLFDCCYNFLCHLGVRLAEKNQLVEAIERFSQAIAINPQYPSSYNNRAQAYQLQGKTEGHLPSIMCLYLIPDLFF